MKKRVLALALTALMCMGVVGLAGCGGQGGADAYVDDTAMTTIARGYEKRSDYISSHDTNSSKGLKAAVQAEIDNDAELKDAKFEDSKMQETVIAYLNSLDAQMEVLNQNEYGTWDYIEAWSKAYDKRSQILKTMVDEYDLKVGDKYKDEFADIVANGTAVSKKAGIEDALNTLFKNAKWEKKDDGYGSCTYVAVIKNTTDYNFKTVSLNVGVYDKDDVKTDNYASVNNWKKGEKAKFEVYTDDIDVDRLEAVVDWYELAE